MYAVICECVLWCSWSLRLHLRRVDGEHHDVCLQVTRVPLSQVMSQHTSAMQAVSHQQHSSSSSKQCSVTHPALRPVLHHPEQPLYCCRFSMQVKLVRAAAKTSKPTALLLWRG